MIGLDPGLCHLLPALQPSMTIGNGLRGGSFAPRVRFWPEALIAHGHACDKNTHKVPESMVVDAKKSNNHSIVDDKQVRFTAEMKKKCYRQLVRR